MKNKKIKRLAILTTPMLIANCVISPFAITASAQNENGFKLTYDGNLKELVSESDKLFEVTSAMPGDVLIKEITFENTNITSISSYFKINDDNVNLTSKEKELAQKTSLLITMEQNGNLNVIYNDNIFNALSSQRTSAIELGELNGKSISKLTFEITIPKSLKNDFALTSLDLIWQITSEDNYTTEIKDPVINPKSKNFTGSASVKDRTVTITCPTENSEIRYTTDGSEPTLNSPLYNGPFVIDKASMTVKAKAFLTTDISCKSNTVTEKYTITAEAPVITPKSTKFKGSSSDLERTVTISYPNNTEIVRYTTDGTDPTENSPIYEKPFVLDQNTTVKAKAWLKYDETCQSTITTESYEIICDKPIIDPPSRKYYTDETPGSVIIMCNTPDAEIHYTIDGTIPTKNSPVYTEPFPIDKDMTVKAISIKKGCTNSEVASESYQINVPLPQSTKPQITPPGGTYDTPQTVKITSHNPDADIYYTIDGSEPTVNSPKYTGPITVDENITVKAIAVEPRHTPSETAVEDYKIKTPKPKITPKGDLYEEEILVKITCSDPKADIYYTINGKTPTINSEKYTKPFIVDKNTTVKAIAVSPNKENSNVTKEDYEIKTEPPIITPESGSYNNNVKVTITCPDLDAEIFYTIDGSNPTEFSTKYTKPFILDKSATVKAIAINPEKSPSEERFKNYIINSDLIAPTISPDSGEYVDFVTVTIKENNDVEGAVIRYTIDGSNPNSKSPIYKGPFVIDKNATVKAISMADGYNDSECVTKQYTIKLSSPTITPDSGTYNSKQTVTITSSIKDAEIYYIIGEGTPATKYIEPFTIDKSTKVTAIATKPGTKDSDPTIKTYEIIIPVEEPTPSKTGVETQKKPNIAAFIAIGISTIAIIVGSVIAIINKKKNKK